MRGRRLLTLLTLFIGEVVASWFATSAQSHRILFGSFYKGPNTAGSPKDRKVAIGLKSFRPGISGPACQRIFEGAEPSGVRAAPTTKFDPALNFETAKAPGRDLPYLLLVAAGEVLG
jgi:hypothetical protein